MATVLSIGAYVTAAGYAGDVQPSWTPRSVGCRRGDDWFYGMEHIGGRSGIEEVVDMWSIDPQNNSPSSYAFYRAMRRRLYGDHEGTEPLLIVIPEVWHEQPSVLRRFAESAYESAVPPAALHLARSSVCAVLGAGTASGVVLDCGHVQTTIAAVSDGYVLRKSIHRLHTGGAHLNEKVRALCDASQLEAMARPLSPFASCEPITEPMRVLSEIDALKRTMMNDQHYIAPDGTPVDLGERGATLIDEFFVGRDPPLPSLVVDCKKSVDVELLPHLDLLLCGGTSQASRFAQKALVGLQQVDANFHTVTNLKVAGPHAIWSGASMIAASAPFQSLWVTRAEWQEHGFSALERKLLS